MFYSNTRLKIISYYSGMNSNFEKCIRFIQQENGNFEVKSVNSASKSRVYCMSVRNVSHLKCISMIIHNGNVVSIKCFKNYLSDERT